MTRLCALRIALILAGTTLSCDSDPTAVCIVLYEDSPISIVEVTSAATGAALGEIFIRDVRLNGNVVTNPATLVGSPSHDVTVEGDQLRCFVSCGFGSQVGNYEFIVRRPGFADKVITVNADYTGSRRDGCTLYLSKGAELRVQLAPLQSQSRV